MNCVVQSNIEVMGVHCGGALLKTNSSMCQHLLFRIQTGLSHHACYSPPAMYLIVEHPDIHAVILTFGHVSPANLT
jgi:hypothetical protein